MTQDLYKIISKAPLGGDCVDLAVNLPEGENEAAEPKPGQFLHILCGDKTLRRPISVCDYNPGSHTVRLVFQVKGEGTRWLSDCVPGEYLDILGPLGNGFPIEKAGARPLLVGGGIGVPPLLYCAKSNPGSADAALGFRSKDNVILLDDFRSVCSDVTLTTDDGTAGRRGFVTDAVREKLASGGYTSVLACGPAPMLSRVAAVAAEYGTECFVSLEERMGCGVGACLVCACKIKTADGETYKHVCKDGPVFNAREVVFS